MADCYENVSRSSLKLKGVSDHKIKKKKKKKSKDSKKEMVGAKTEETNESDQASTDKPHIMQRTKAELEFQQTQERRTAERLLTKAGKSHKERIMEFNAHLDNLTEHFDIPKVSWTK